MRNGGTRPALDARWPVVGVLLATLVVILLAAWVFPRRPLPLLALTRPDLAALEQEYQRQRDACVAGPPQGAACVSAARLAHDIAVRRRGLI